MGPQLQALLERLGDDALNTVAVAVLGTTTISAVQNPLWQELSAPHNDRRTTGIVRVKAGALLANGTTREWSAVVKVIDTTVEAGSYAFWINPENEDIIYERQLFTRDNQPFRPARCYRVDRPSPTSKVLWLEDLTDAAGPPFEFGELRLMAGHVGRWNGSHFVHPTHLGFAIPTDSYLTRWRGAGFRERLATLPGLAEHPYVRQLYGDTPLSAAIELFDQLDRLNACSTGLPHGLAFGDCQPGNLFIRDAETVAIDWASMTNDPLGVDAGCMIGSSLLWGRDSAETARQESTLFEAYLAGLRESGWVGKSEDVRRAFFGHFGTYLLYVATLPVLMASGDSQRHFLERRLRTPWNEIPSLLSGIPELMPAFAAEVAGLLDRTGACTGAAL